MAKTKIKNCCINHPNRIAAVDRAGSFLCWQCYLGTDRFLQRFSRTYYPDFTPDRPAGKSHLNIHLTDEVKTLLTRDNP